MTKADMIESVYEKFYDISRRGAAEVVETLFDIIKETLKSGEDVKLSGFGNFNIQHKKARRGRNPQTGQSITISARRIVSYRPSKVLRGQLNS